MTLAHINEWHKRARPDPTTENFNVQLGCHAEEFHEMLECLAVTDGRIAAALEAVKKLADGLKDGSIKTVITDRGGMLDSIADQIVTGVGVAHCAYMDVITACDAVNASNWSKFDANGQPIFNDNGKIIKGPGYFPPSLDGLY